jgi:hypothetical protein
MDAEVAEVTIAALEDTGKLRDTAEKDLKYVVDTTEGKRTEELQRVTQAKEQEAQLLSDMSSFVDTTLEKGNVGSFTIPKADQTKFNEFVKNSIQIKDGQFYTVSDVNQDNFNDVLQTLFFAYKGGNIDSLAKVQAKKDNVRRLKQRASSSKIAGQRSEGGSKITKLGDL